MFKKKNNIRRPREFRWFTRGMVNGRVTVLGGFTSEDEAESAGLKMTGGYYECKLLPTVDIDEASRMFRYKLFDEAQSEEDMSQVFKRFKHQIN